MWSQSKVDANNAKAQEALTRAIPVLKAIAARFNAENTHSATLQVHEINMVSFGKPYVRVSCSLPNGETEPLGIEAQATYARVDRGYCEYTGKFAISVDRYIPGVTRYGDTKKITYREPKSGEFDIEKPLQDILNHLNRRLAAEDARKKRQALEDSLRTYLETTEVKLPSSCSHTTMVSGKRIVLTINLADQGEYERVVNALSSLYPR